MLNAQLHLAVRKVQQSDAITARGSSHSAITRDLELAAGE